MSQITITKTTDGKFIFTLTDTVRQVLFTSISYPNVADVTDAIASLKSRAGLLPNFERKKTATNKMYFVIRSEAGQVIGSSEQHGSIAALENSIAAVNQCAGDADILDAF